MSGYQFEGIVPDSALRHIAEFLWEQSPGHDRGAYSKVLVSGQREGTNLDFRISSYEPHAGVDGHLHEAKEQIYYFLSGEGLLQIGNEKVITRPHSFVHIEPGVPHSLINTGLTNLVFLVITALVPQSDAD
ncbi:MAG: cupin domain-containing protein [Nitratireductor sp.]|nr:cupin domain-containing protein [Nitratireductor sp.]